MTTGASSGFGDGIVVCIDGGAFEADDPAPCRAAWAAIWRAPWVRAQVVELAAVVWFSEAESAPTEVHFDCPYVVDGAAAMRAGAGHRYLAGVRGDLWRRLRRPWVRLAMLAMWRSGVGDRVAWAAAVPSPVGAGWRRPKQAAEQVFRLVLARTARLVAPCLGPHRGFRCRGRAPAQRG